MRTAAQPSQDSSKKKGLLRFFWWFFIIGALIFFPYMYSNDVKYLYQKYLVNDHQELVNYLDKINLTLNSGEEITRNVRYKLYRLTAEEYDNLVQKGKDNLQKLIEEVNRLTPPSEFNPHKESVIAVLNQHILVLNNYQEAKRTNLYEDLNKSIEDLNSVKELERQTLFTSFKNAGIEYTQLEDGSFRFWYKNHSAKPLNNSK
jgi:hypothetical protein